MMRSIPAQHRQIVDELIDDYVAWREACAEVAVAHQRSTLKSGRAPAPVL